MLMMVVVTPPFRPPQKKKQKKEMRGKTTPTKTILSPTKLRPAGDTHGPISLLLFHGKAFPLPSSPFSFGINFCCCFPLLPHLILCCCHFRFPGKQGASKWQYSAFFHQNVCFFRQFGHPVFLKGGGACLRRGKEMPENLANKEEEGKSEMCLFVAFLSPPLFRIRCCHFPE